jgi:hypothetical protein
MNDIAAEWDAEAEEFERPASVKAGAQVERALVSARYFRCDMPSPVAA